MITYWKLCSGIKDRVFIPKYYDPTIEEVLSTLSVTCSIVTIRELVKNKKLSVTTGHEIGKMAYGTGDIPFVRTSDISNWEIKTAPKQGVSIDIYNEYSGKQDVKVGDILLVRDGTYLIGTNCIVTEIDSTFLFQSHILKFRVLDVDVVNPYLLFGLLNSEIVQQQIRSFQFTADTIDTIGSRYLDIALPIPGSTKRKEEIAQGIKAQLNTRDRGKAFIKHLPSLMERILATNSLEGFREFIGAPMDRVINESKRDTIAAEFGNFEAFWVKSDMITNKILLPKYYDPEVGEELKKLNSCCDCISIGELVHIGEILCNTGDEIGKMAYGTGNIPFIRTSDFSDWEIKHDPKQGISQEIYDEYANRQNVQPGDILLVRDGTYLIGSSCLIPPEDSKMLYCGGLYKIRVLNRSRLNPYLLLGLLNSYIVKRQIRTKQFTRDVIDTLGKRLFEIILPIPKSPEVRLEITEAIKSVFDLRIVARLSISMISDTMFDLTDKALMKDLKTIEEVVIESDNI